MEKKHLQFSFLVDKSSKDVFSAINNVKGWWSEELEGNSQNINDEFIYRHKDMHYSKQKLVEVIPDKKVVWLVTDCLLSFVKNKTEWTGTTISFELSVEGDKTRLIFTHYGLVSECECYDACSQGWSYYLEQSLLKLINTGKGQPDKKEN